MEVQSKTNLKNLEKKAIEIGIDLACRLSLYDEEYSGERERKVTKSNLSNMLKAAYMAEKINSYTAFEVSVAYLARDTDKYDELNWFVRSMIRELRNLFRQANLELSDKEKIEIAKRLIETVLMVYNARKASINIICPRRRW